MLERHTLHVRAKLICCLMLLLPLSNFAQPSGFVDELFLAGWSGIVGFTFDDNGRMYAWEKRGHVYIVENGVRQTPAFINIADEVGNWGDHGLVGFALDPNFLSNGHMYLWYVVDQHHLLNFGTGSYNPNANNYNSATIGRITRYTADASNNFNSLVPNSRLILFGETKETGAPILHSSHGVGQLVFGTDGTLLASMGDGASFSSVDEGSAPETYWQEALNLDIITPAENVGAYRCQQLFSHNGKILRLDPATGDGVPSNPFWDGANPRSAQSRTWALGLRNAYRMNKKPGTGSHFEADGDPGLFIFGDVGWGNREELCVVDGPGLNFGWPKWEGMTNMPGYNDPAFEPPLHERPKVDWRNGVPRVLVNGTIFDVGSAQFPGPIFGGNASTGGVWYTGDDFPPEYKNTYFHGDYGQDWVRNFSFDNDYNPTEIKNFLSNIGPVVFIGTHPTEGNLYYVRYSNQIRRVTYDSTVDQPPVAVAFANQEYGPSPLTVAFIGDHSFDPGFGSLSYSWDFGDGNTSTMANPVHQYVMNNGQATEYTVTLTVTDNEGLSDQTTLTVSLNNTPPQILSTSIDNTNTFPTSGTTTLNLNAVVVDAEHNNSLSYTWQTTLHHNDHEHPEPEDNNASTTTILSPVGCNGASFWYRITLTVTDPAGLSDSFSKDIYPACSGNSQTIDFPAIGDKFLDDPPFLLSATASSGLPITYYVHSGPGNISGSTVTLTGKPGTLIISAQQHGDATYAPANPVFQTVQVLNPNGSSLPSDYCAASGSAPWEEWISNVSLADLNNDSEKNGYGDFTSEVANVVQGNNYTLSLQTAYSYTNWDEYFRVWIDYNQDGDFTDSGEEVFSGISPAGQHGTQPPPLTSSINIPGTAFVGNTRMRVAMKRDAYAGPCESFIFGEVEDYTLNIQDAGGGPFDQTINFPPIPDKQTTDPPFTISATASSGLPVSFSIISGPATISGNTITLNGTAGTVVVRASQAGNAQWNPAPDVDQSFQVNEPGAMNQTINFPPIPDKLTIDPPFTISATATSGLPVSFSILSGPATISGNTITLNGTVGTVVVRASQSGNAQWNPAPDVDQSFQVIEGGGGNYCASSGSAPWEEWIGNVTFSGINNDSGKNGYGDFTAQVATVTQGMNHSLSVNVAYSYTNWDEYVRVWIDYNQDGDFLDADEEVFSAISPAGQHGSQPPPVTGNISIPSGASLGTTRMRVSMQRGAYAGACDEFSFGEVEDYSVNILPGGGGPFDQTISFPAIPDKFTTDPPFTVNATASSGLPVSYSILSGPATISGNTITLDGVVGTVVVRASQSGNAQWNPAPDVDQSFQVIEPGGPTEYCATGGSQPWHEWIGNVTFGSINNTTFKNGYGDFTGQVATVNAGSTFTISLTASYSWQTYDEYFRVWIDYNQDGVFQEPGEIAFSGVTDTPPNGTTSAIVTGSISIPGTAMLGLTRMRVAMQRDAYAPPCGTFDFGEVEDYSVQISSGGASSLVVNDYDKFRFEARKENQTVKLDWLTNTEYKTDHFVIERSYDSNVFQPLEEVDAKTEGYSVIQYQQRDEDPQKGTNYYRLKQVFKTGGYRYSDVLKVEFEQDPYAVYLWPNPVEEELFVQLKKYKGESGMIRIYNQLGVEVMQKELEQISPQAIKLELNGFQNGVYRMTIKVGEHRLVTRNFVVANLY